MGKKSTLLKIRIHYTYALFACFLAFNFIGLSQSNKGNSGNPASRSAKISNASQSVEDVSLRNEFSRTFKNADGTFSKQQSLNPLHYKDEKGKWATIQKTPERNKANPALIEFSRTDLPISVNTQSGVSKMFLKKNKMISFGEEAKVFWLNKDKTVSKTISQSSAVANHVFNDNEVLLKNVFPDIDRKQRLEYDHLRTDYILNQSPNLSSSVEYVVFEDQVTLPPNWKIKYGSGEMTEAGWKGELEITDENNVLSGSFSIPVFYDAFQSSDKSQLKNHIVKGTYKIEKSGNGYAIQILVPVKWLNAPERVYPVTVDPTVSGTKAPIGFLKGYAYNSDCQETLAINVPAGTITGTETTYSITTQNGGWRSEQHSRVGCDSWSGDHTNTNDVAGTENYSFSGLTIANGLWCGGNRTFTWQGYRTWDADSDPVCDDWHQYRSGNWVVTVTYTVSGALPAPANVGWSGPSGGSPTAPTCGNWSGTWCAGSGTNTSLSFIQGINYSVENTGDASCGTAMPSAYLQAWWNGGSTACGFGAIGSPGVNTISFDAPGTGNHNINVSSNSCGAANSCGLGTGHDFSGSSAVLRYRQNTTVTNTTSTADICLSETKSLTATLGGAHNNPTIVWSVVSGGGSIAGATYTPASSGSVTVRATVGNCTSDATFNVVGANVTPTFTAVPAICTGAALSALPTTSTNSITGSWSPALDNTTTTTYTFTPDAGQCATTATMTITVNSSVTPGFNAIVPICAGAALSALPTTSTNSITGSWSPALDNTATATYTFTPDAGQCATTATMTITVNPVVTPTFNAVAPICAGTALSALPTTSTNSITGTWSPALDNTTTTTYTFTPDAGQCASTATLTITVNSNATPTFSAVAPICSGDALSALPTTSANSITGTWSPALDNTTTTTYTFTPNAGQCAVGTTMTITVKSLPTAGVVPSVTDICPGETATLTASGGTTYAWSPSTGLSATSGAVVNASPTTTQTYTVVATDNGCSDSETVTITVTPIPVMVSADVTSVCAGESATLTASGAVTYSWTPATGLNATTGDEVIATPTATQTYTVTGTDGLCQTSQNITITVKTNPTVSVTPPVANLCAGSSITLTGNGASTYVWLPTLSSGGTVTVSPMATTTYTALGTASNGCVGTATATVTVTLPASATISYTGLPFCTSVSAPQPVSRTGTTGGTYTSTAGLSINASTGAITPSTSSAGTYTVTYSIPATGGCALYTTTTSVTINAVPTATITYPGSPFCSTLTLAQNVSRTGAAGGTYTSTSGLNLDPSTGEIIPSSSTPGTYTVTYTIPASSGCPAVTATASVTITAPPSATISYAGTPFCTSVSAPQSVSHTGTTGGTYSGTAGLTINATTGAITPSSSSPGSHTVTYTVAAAGGCAVYTTTASIDVNPLPVATITYPGSPFCGNLSIAQNVAQTGTAGGAYTSTAGLTINSTTGAITPSLSTPGTYTITYTIAASGGCPAVTATTSVTITAAPSATVSYAGTPFCTSLPAAQAATLVGTTGGTYSSTAGLTINASTGAITPSSSTAGTYTVTYTIAAAAGCPVYTTTGTVVITAAPTATITYPGSPFCGNLSIAQNVAQIGTAGGTYTSTAGLTIDASTGAITPSTSTAGTYTVTYTIAAASGCPAVTATASVTITTAPSATISYASPFCMSLAGAQSVTLTGTTGGTYSSTAGLTINASTGAVTPSSSTAGGYTVTYTIAAAGGCPVYTTTTPVTINPVPTATIFYPGSPFCGNVSIAQNVSQSGTTGGVYTSTAGLTINAATGAITPSTSTAGTYTVTYTIAASGGCAAVTTTASVVINPAPAATISYASPFCMSTTAPQAVTLTGTTGGTYSSTAGLTINATTGAITPSTSIASTYTVTYTIAAAGGCPVYTATASVTVNPVPAATISYSGSPFCGNVSSAQSVTQTGTTGGTYTSAPGLTINTATGAITPSTSTAGTYTITYTIAAASGCPAVTATATVVITTPPAATISYAGSPFCNSISTAQAVTQTGTTGGIYSSTPGLTISAISGAITPSSSVTNTYTVTYSIAAANGCPVTTATTTITVNPLPTASISYTGSPFCGNLPAQSVTQTGATGGTYTSTAGLSVNASTGAVDPSASTAGTYTVTYTIAAASGCPAVTATASVTITAPPAATISYAGSPFCSNTSVAQAVTHTGTTGGTYSSTAGLTINATTGAITPSTSTPATYTVTYTMAAANGCPVTTATTSVTVNPIPAATISYTGSPFCGNLPVQSVTLTGTTGGTFTSASGLSINASTGAINPSASTAGTYTITYTISAGSGCPAVTATASVAITAPPAATISYAGSPFCNSLTGAQAVTQTGTTGGTYSSTAGLTINAATGAITPSTSTPAIYTVTYTMAAANGCPVTTATTLAAVTNAPSASISYPGSPFCASVSGAQAVTLTGTTGGTFTSTAGLSLDATTGAVDPSLSTAGTYTVTYTIAAAGGCAALTVTTTVTVNAIPTASIAYSSAQFCSSIPSAQPIILTGTTGGTYSSTTGLNIDATTGAVTPNLSTPGLYTVTYDVTPAGCSMISATTSIEIVLSPTASISYAGPYCASVPTAQPVVLAGTGNYTGGSYSASPTGLNINASTGEIIPNLSTAGTYLVTYTVPASSGCSSGTATANVTITPTPSAVISYASPFCSTETGTQPVTFSGSTGGTFSSTTGLTIDAATGEITASTSVPGTYVVTYTTLPAGSCPPGTATSTVEIKATPVINDLADLDLCDQNYTLPVITGTSLSGSQMYFTAPNGGGTSYAAGQVITATTSLFIYDANGACSDEESFTVTINQTPVITNMGDQTACGVYVLPAIAGTNLSGSQAYYNNSQALGGTIISGSLFTSQTVWIYDANGTCSDEESFEVTINIVPDASFTASNYCGGTATAPVVIGASGGTFVFNPAVTDGATIDATTGLISGGITGTTYTIQYTVPGPCPASSQQQVTFNVIPASPSAGNDATYCSAETFAGMTASAVSGGTLNWYNDAALTNQVGTGTSVVPGNVNGVTTYYVTETVNGCASLPATVDITVNESPAAPDAGNSITYCKGDTISDLVATGLAGNTFTWYNDPALTSQFGTGSSITPLTVLGETTYYVTQTSANACESAAASVTVTINDCFELEVSSAFTPGDGDNINNFWEIPELNARYPDNKVTIFNRWGQILFESNGYATPWDGTYKGEVLPVGSYYYIIEFHDADKTPNATGTVTIIRN